MAFTAFIVVLMQVLAIWDTAYWKQNSVTQNHQHYELRDYRTFQTRNVSWDRESSRCHFCRRFYFLNFHLSFSTKEGQDSWGMLPVFSVCTSLCVCCFPASLGLQNRLVNKEVEVWVSILDILNYWEGILLYLYTRSNVWCEAFSSTQWPFHVVFF